MINMIIYVLSIFVNGGTVRWMTEDKAYLWNWIAVPKTCITLGWGFYGIYIYIYNEQESRTLFTTKYDEK